MSALPWEWLNGGEPLVPDVIPEALKRPWLNAAPDLVTPEQQQRDIAATVEAVTFHAIVAHWDDVVPCNVKTLDGYVRGTCDRPAYWVYHCPCGRAVTVCTPHKVMADTPPTPRCMDCSAVMPSPIPWLPL